MSYSNKKSVLVKENRKKKAEKDAFDIATSLCGKPNPDWTQEEWESILKNLVDVLRDKVNVQPIKEECFGGWFANIGEVVIQVIRNNCSYAGTKIEVGEDGMPLVCIW